MKAKGVALPVASFVVSASLMLTCALCLFAKPVQTPTNRIKGDFEGYVHVVRQLALTSATETLHRDRQNRESQPEAALPFRTSQQVQYLPVAYKSGGRLIKALHHHHQPVRPTQSEIQTEQAAISTDAISTDIASHDESPGLVLVTPSNLPDYQIAQAATESVLPKETAVPVEITETLKTNEAETAEQPPAVEAEGTAEPIKTAEEVTIVIEVIETIEETPVVEEVAIVIEVIETIEETPVVEEVAIVIKVIETIEETPVVEEVAIVIEVIEAIEATPVETKNIETIEEAPIEKEPILFSTELNRMNF